MKKIKQLLLLAIFGIITLSCSEDEVLTESYGITCTGIFNDENEDGLASVGETITYTFSVKNTGNVRLSAITINDTVLGIENLVIEEFVLVPDDTTIKTFEYSIVAQDLDNGMVTNQTTVSAININNVVFTDLSSPTSFEEDAETIVSFTPSFICEKGFFITNEGPFASGSGTLTFVKNATGDVTQNMYHSINNEDLGSIVQSMYLNENRAFIVVNNSHKVVITHRFSLEKITVLEGAFINNPRNVVVVDNRAYISNWGNAADTTDDFITVVNLEDYTVVTTIPVGEGPEKMLVVGDKIYVNLQGGHNQNNKVEVIDTTTNSVSTTITVDNVPNSMVKDTDGSIWVLCGGNPTWATSGIETNGSLIKIVDDAVDTTLAFETTEHPNHLTMNGSDLIYTLGDKVYATENTATELNTISIDGLDGFHYSILAHNGKLYATDAGDFSSEGTLKIFDLSTNTIIRTISTGIIPGSVVFND